MSNKLVTIAEFADSMQADMARQTLEEFGIRAMILDQNIANLGYPPMPWNTVKLQVLESDVDQARQVLEEQQQEAHEPEDYEVGDDSDDDEPYEPDEEEK
jgi:hypothetical protein